MSRRQMIIDALTHKETPLLPYHMEFTEQALKLMVEYTANPDIEEALGSCIHYIQYWGWPTELAERPEHFVDDFGVVWNRSGADKDIGVVEDPQIADLDDYSYTFPKVDEVRLRSEYEQLVRQKGDRFTVAGFGFSMFERSWSLMGMEGVLMAMITNPDELEKLYDDICDYLLGLVDIALEYDIDGVYFGDDWGQQKGLIMGAEHWRHYIKPRMAKLYARAKSKGKFVLQHSCGDIEEIFDDLIEIGLDCYQTFQPEIYDIAAVKAKYGSRLAFWGGISTQQCLPQMNAEQVRQETERVIGVMRPGGGYIAAPTHALTHDIPCENILAMAEVFIKAAGGTVCWNKK